MKEQELQKHIMKILSMNGYIVTRINGVRNGYVKSYYVHGFGSTGFPDLIAMKGKEFLLIEVKTEKGKLSENQTKFQQFAKHKDIDVHVVRSIEDALALINTHQNNESFKF